MATYVNDLRLKEIATGDESGTWGTSTNTNLELIAEAFSYGTEASFGSDADATTTIADGSTDPARSLYLKVTSGASLTATRTLTIAPNTVSKVWIIENATSGSQSINISQGSGANVTIPNGDVKVIYSDGAGAGAAVVDAFTDLNLGGTTTVAGLSSSGAIVPSASDAAALGSASLEWSDLFLADGGVINLGDDQDTTLTHVADTGILLNSTRQLQFGDSGTYIHQSADGVLDLVSDTEIEINATTVDMNGNLDLSGTINNMTVASNGSGFTCPTSQNFIINSPNGLRINIDSNNDGSSENFVVGHNQNDATNANNLLKISEAGTSTFFSTGTTDTVVLQSTDAGASAAPDLVLFRDSSSPADGDDIGNILFRGKDDGGNETSYAFIMGEINDASDGSEDGNLFFRTQSGGSLDNRISIVSNLVGIGQDAPNAPLEVLKDITFSSADTFPQIVIRTDSGSTGDQLGFGVDKADSLAFIQATERGTNVIPLVLQRYGGRVGIGVDAPNTILDVQASASNLFSVTGVVSGGIEAFKMRQSRGSLSSPTNSAANGDGNYLISQIYRDSAYNTCANIGMVTGASTDDGEIRFSTALSGTVAEKMRLDENGKLGLGTTSPSCANGGIHVVHADDEGSPSFSGAEVGIFQRNFNNAQGAAISIVGGSNSESAVNFADKDDANVGQINYSHADNAMIFRVNDSERVRIDSNGNMGIAGTPPSDANTGYPLLSIGETTVIQGLNDSNESFFSNNAIWRSDNSWEYVKNIKAAQMLFADGATIFREAVSGTAGNDITWSESMRIDDNNDILIGTTSAVRGSEKVSIDGSTADIIACKTAAAGLIIRKTSFTNGFLLLFERDDNGFAVGQITTNGTSTTYTTSSDYRLKENIQPMENGLDRVKQLNPVKFKWKQTGVESEGFIAHEVDEIYSECVNGEKDGERMQTMDYGRITPLLVKAIQEQQEQIDALKSEIKNLKGE